MNDGSSRKRTRTGRAWLLAVLVLVVVLLGGLWLVLRDGASVGPDSPATAEVEMAATSDDSLPAPAPSADRHALESTEEALVPEPPEPAPPVVPASAPAPAEIPDLEAKEEIGILVVDEEGLPIADAVVMIRGLRSTHRPGSWHGFRGEKPSRKTDWEGRVSLSYWVWVDLDGRTIAVDLNISHPDFVSFRDSSFRIREGEHRVVLRRGSSVVVTAWTGSPPRVLTEGIEIRVDSDALVRPDAWALDAQGRFSTDRIPPGPHLIWVEYAGDEGGRCFSEIEAFELAEGELKELSIEVHGPGSLEGVLDDNVPRPIVDGHVLISVVRVGSHGREPSLGRKFEAPIRPDGTFTVEAVPRGRGQIFALCRGWVSRRTLADHLADAGAGGSGNRMSAERRAKRIERLGDRAYQLQRFEIPTPIPPLTVLMEPTGTVEVMVQRENGTPLSKATVYASPNVKYNGIGSSIVRWRNWRSTTDPNGWATVVDVPPDDRLWIGARHPEFQMRREDRDRSPEVKVVAGQTSKLTITLEPRTD